MGSSKRATSRFNPNIDDEQVWIGIATEDNVGEMRRVSGSLSVPSRQRQSAVSSTLYSVGLMNLRRQKDVEVALGENQ